jgi:hypothetical protein
MPRSCRVGYFSVLSALSVFSAPLAAQTDSVPIARRHPPPSVGAMVGYSRSDLMGPDAEQVRTRQGGITGVYILAPLTRYVYFRPELLFSLKGGRTLTDNALLDIELAYLELPMLAKVVLSRGRFRPLLFGGPAPALQIGCNLQVVAGDQSSRVTCNVQDQSSPFRTFDMGLVAGGGLEIRWPGSGSALAVEARYTAGLRSVFDDAEVKNRALGILIALTF